MLLPAMTSGTTPMRVKAPPLGPSPPAWRAAEEVPSSWVASGRWRAPSSLGSHPASVPVTPHPPKWNLPLHPPPHYAPPTTLLLSWRTTLRVRPLHLLTSFPLPSLSHLFHLRACQKASSRRNPRNTSRRVSGEEEQNTKTQHNPHCHPHLHRHHHHLHHTITIITHQHHHPDITMNHCAVPSLLLRYSPTSRWGTHTPTPGAAGPHTPALPLQHLSIAPAGVCVAEGEMGRWTTCLDPSLFG